MDYDIGTIYLALEKLINAFKELESNFDTKINILKEDITDLRCTVNNLDEVMDRSYDE